ncbi:uncharacterized protein LOC117792667 [Drosophila innubila]|uniref:uncharacterized protein LOC117792667 n=1 Tax=Drosophila innubila TaxID=198719 RepID=UPI00148E5DD4|nr:uncharacterized protein LOC117792667 [Drosophila innubila]
MDSRAYAGESDKPQALNKYNNRYDSALVDKDVLCIIIDYDANQGYLRRDTELFAKVISYLIFLANAHLLQRPANDLAIFGYSSRSVNYIYPEECYGTVFFNDSSELLFEELNEMRGESESESESENPRIKQSSTSLLSGTISKALAYVRVKHVKRCKLMQGYSS